MSAPKFKFGEEVFWTHNQPFDAGKYEVATIIEEPMKGLRRLDAENWVIRFDKDPIVYLIKTSSEVVLVAESVLERIGGWDDCPGDHRKSRGRWKRRVT